MSGGVIVINYAGHTNGARNLAELRRYGWRLLRTPFTTGSTNHGFQYCLDNGAWRAHQKGIAFNEVAFVEMLDTWAKGADFIVVPDIVAGGLGSLEFSLGWIPRLARFACDLLLIPVQDGMTARDVSSHLGPTRGIFVGGSTEFKESTTPMWGELAVQRGCWLHVGRVNSARRIAICAEAGADSIDGTSATKFAVTTRGLTKASRQMSLLSPKREMKK